MSYSSCAPCSASPGNVAWPHHLLSSAAQERAETANSLATAQGFPFWSAYSSILRGWALVHQGQVQEGIEQIRQGLMAFRATGAELLPPYFMALLAEAYGTIGQSEAGLTVLTGRRS
jgi:predicted ATPase